LEVTAGLEKRGVEKGTGERKKKEAGVQSSWKDGRNQPTESVQTGEGEAKNTPIRTERVTGLRTRWESWSLFHKISTEERNGLNSGAPTPTRRERSLGVNRVILRETYKAARIQQGGKEGSERAEKKTFIYNSRKHASIASPNATLKDTGKASCRPLGGRGGP